MTRNNNNNMPARVAAAAVVVAVLSAGMADATVACTADICPYGYARNTATDVAALTVELCCDQDTGIISFPKCNSPTSGGSTGVQALSSDATSWLVQDGNGFTRTVNKFTGEAWIYPYINPPATQTQLSHPVTSTAI